MSSLGLLVKHDNEEDYVFHEDIHNKANNTLGVLNNSSRSLRLRLRQAGRVKAGAH